MAKEKTAQEYLIKSKLYRFVSYFFVGLGLLVFCILYVQNVEGRLLQALKHPMIVAVFLVPFFPAIVLTLLADRAEKKYQKMTTAAKDASEK